MYILMLIYHACNCVRGENIPFLPAHLNPQHVPYSVFDGLCSGSQNFLLRIVARVSRDYGSRRVLSDRFAYHGHPIEQI